MKIDNRTLQILKNFASINQSMLFKPGKELSTLATSKSILAKAKIDMEIPSDFAIWDLSRFLGTVSLFSDPDIAVGKNQLTINEGKKKINYTFTEPSLILAPPDKELVLPTPEIEFKITTDELNAVFKAQSVLGVPEISVTGKDGVISINAVDSKNTSGDTYSIDIGETSDTFNMVFRAENLKLLPGDYEVKITSKGLSHFSGENIDYWISIESNSTFEKN